VLSRHVSHELGLASPPTPAGRRRPWVLVVRHGALRPRYGRVPAGRVLGARAPGANPESIRISGVGQDGGRTGGNLARIKRRSPQRS